LRWLSTAAIVAVAGAAVAWTAASGSGATASLTSSVRPAAGAVDAAPSPTGDAADPGGGTAPAAAGNLAPTAVVVVGEGSVAGTPVTFSSQGSSDPEGSPLRYRWDFGDQTFPPATEPSPTHVYAQPGTYTVTLSVTDAAGATATATAQVVQRARGGAVSLASPVVQLPGVNTSQPIRVWYEGQRPGSAVIAKVCRRSIDDPRFREDIDCSLLSEVVINGTSSGAGWLDVPVFRGPELGGDGAWGCFAAGDAPSAGVEKLTTCYIRITNNVGSNTRDDREVAFTLG
jgi:PKD repeat protein